MSSSSFAFFGLCAGYALLLVSSPVRAYLLDGVRIMRRYPALPGILGLCGFGYALFHLALRWPAAHLPVAGEEPASWGWRTPFWLWPPGGGREAARAALMPTFDSTAGLFNNLVTTFPLAALAAIGLLVNWSGVQGHLWSALRRRCGGWALFIHPLILLTACAALAKPALYFFLPAVEARWGAAWPPVIVWLAFAFEYLVGLGVQLYLMLLAYCWVRGLSVRPEKLRAFAIRRLAFVLRWAAVIMVLSTLLIDLPLILASLPFTAPWFAADAEALDRRALLARVLLDALFLATSTVPITLLLHNESLRRSWRDHAGFVRRHAWPLGWFLLQAGASFFLLHWGCQAALLGLGAETLPGLLSSLVFPWLAGLVGAWLLAAWVSFFRQTAARRAGAIEPARF